MSDEIPEADMSALDSWLDTLKPEPKRKKPSTGEITLANAYAAMRKPPVVQGYIAVNQPYHCLTCGHDWEMFHGIYRAELDGLTKVIRQVTEPGPLRDLPIHFHKATSKSVELCVECMPKGKSAKLAPFLHLLEQ